MSLWISNTSGKKDAVLTLTLIGFLFVLFKLLVSGSSLVFESTKLTFGNIDAATIAAILTPTLGAYVARRYTDKKFVDDADVESDV